MKSTICIKCIIWATQMSIVVRREGFELREGYID